MKNSKKLFLIFLSVLIVAFVSCKKDSGGSITTPTPTFKPSSLVGTWKNGDAHNFTVGEGNITSIKINNVTATKTITIDTWKEDKDKDVSEYTQSLTKQQIGQHTYDFVFTFKSASSCVATITEDSGAPQSFTLTKQPTTK
ncbi:hypothetical protein EPJ67_08515 [Brachyspira aalborgi]|uniref:Lipocalin-like domain-containing protein n=1 Tax=Brachyspira aalborgi TaxID=29522 RepID=A0A5C8G2N6_9SPIR|nr:hypothetical protein [Brachyspira aalborgi]TXJ56283.1 hypothetical protein EPJ67_08515 [Brachyspira aalborgi]